MTQGSPKNSKFIRVVFKKIERVFFTFKFMMNEKKTYIHTHQQNINMNYMAMVPVIMATSTVNG